MSIISNFLIRHWESKVNFELKFKAAQHRQIENKKIIDTMIALATIGELTPERYEFFLKMLSQ